MRQLLLIALTAALLGGVAAQAQIPPEAELVRRLDSDEMERIFPQAARIADRSGQVILECTARAGGAVDDCAVMLESPAGYGFGDASIEAAPGLRIRNPKPGERVRVPLEWRIGGAGAEVVENRTPIAAAPVLIYRRSTYYPPQAERAKLEGRAVVECLVMSDYRVTACKVLGEAPIEHGFGEAGVRRVALLTVRPSRETGPTAGRKVRFPIYWKPMDSREDALVLRPDDDIPVRRVRRGPTQ